MLYRLVDETMRILLNVGLVYRIFPKINEIKAANPYGMNIKYPATT
jgi:hypothetical protein